MQQLISVIHWLALLGACVCVIEFFRTRWDSHAFWGLGADAWRWVWLLAACSVVFFGTGGVP